MSLHGKEKVWFLINTLIDEREVTPASQPVSLHPMNDLNNQYGKLDFIQLTEKLEKEHKVIKLLNKVPTDQTYGKYLIELLPNFDKYVQELRKDPKYLEWIGEKPIHTDQDKSVHILDYNLAYWQNLELLAQLVIRICKIYDAFFENKEDIKEDEHLNTLYVALVIKVDRLLEDPRLKELRSKRPRLHKGFSGRVNDISKEYDNDFRSKLWNFYDETNDLSVEFTADTGGLKLEDPTIQFFLDDIDESIKRHRELSSGNEYRRQNFPETNSDASARSKVTFNWKNSALLFENMTCDIPDETLEHYVCRFAFKNRHVAANEDDILEKTVKSQDSKRAVYDAVLRVNKKAREHFGIEKLLSCKAAKVRITTKYQ